MRTSAEKMMEECLEHQEKQEIFYLEKMLIEAGYPYYFNYREETKTTERLSGENTKKSIDWKDYNFLIEIGRPAGHEYPMLSIQFSTKGNPKLLELLDMRPAEDKRDPTKDDGELYYEITSEEAMEIIEKFFDVI